MSDLEKRLTELCGGLIREADDQKVYFALMTLVKERAEQRNQPVSGRKLYYISAEFLIGRMLANNLRNLGIYNEAERVLGRAGKSLSDLEALEKEPSLGNGGLGRLAACFLDSLATMNLPGDGVGLLYHCGLFRQKFEGALQKEEPDRWLTENGWAERTETVFEVSLAGKRYRARLWRLPVVGFEGRTNRLNLFDLRDAAKDHKIKQNKPKEELKPMEKTMKVEGLMCMHCDARVKKVLEALPEVAEATANHETGIVVVTLNAPVADEVLKKTVEDQDYKVLSVE